MSQIPTNLDLSLQSTEAELSLSFEKMIETITAYSDLYYRIEMVKENSAAVNIYLDGLRSISTSFNAIIDATELIASIKGVEIDNK